MCVCVTILDGCLQTVNESIAYGSNTAKVPKLLVVFVDVPCVVQNLTAVHSLNKFPLLADIRRLIVVLTRLVH